MEEQVLDVNVIDIPKISRMAHYLGLLLTTFDVYYLLFLYYSFSGCDNEICQL
jgi:hypothetical protein